MHCCRLSFSSSVNIFPSTKYYTNPLFNKRYCPSNSGLCIWIYLTSSTSTMSLFFHSALTANTWLPDISRSQLSELKFLYDCAKHLYLS